RRQVREALCRRRSLRGIHVQETGAGLLAVRYDPGAFGQSGRRKWRQAAAGAIAHLRSGERPAPALRASSPLASSNRLGSGISRVANVPCLKRRSSSSALDARSLFWSNSRLPSENVTWNSPPCSASTLAAA